MLKDQKERNSLMTLSRRFQSQSWLVGKDCKLGPKMLQWDMLVSKENASSREGALGSMRRT
jgi:hypothetical protein